MRNSRSLLRFLLGSAGCIFNNAVARPSAITGADYNQLSAALFPKLQQRPDRRESGKDAVLQVEQVVKAIVHEFRRGSLPFDSNEQPNNRIATAHSAEPQVTVRWMASALPSPKSP